jgi:hypothetical protein
VTEARKVTYALTFDGQAEPLALTIPPGHYLIVKLAEAPADKPGLSGVSKPSEPEPPEPLTPRAPARRVATTPQTLAAVGAETV